MKRSLYLTLFFLFLLTICIIQSRFWLLKRDITQKECAMFSRSRAITCLVCLVPLCYFAFVVTSRFLNFSWVFCGLDFQIVRFSVVDCMRKSDRKHKCINTEYSIPHRSQQLPVMFTLERYFIYQISYAITQLSFALFVIQSQNNLPYCLTDYSNFWLLTFHTYLF